MALPANVGFCRVTGRIIRGLLDGADAGRDPDGIPLAGLTVVFRPGITPAIVRNVSADPPVLIAIDPFTATTNADGVLIGPDNLPDVWLIASNDPDLDPSGWTWAATISGPTLAAVTFQFVAPAGGVVDIASVARVPASPGTALLEWQAAVERTEAARDVVLATQADAVTSPGGLVIELVDELPPVQLPGHLYLVTPTI